jgi:hypothetical protein
MKNPLSNLDVSPSKGIDGGNQAVTIPGLLAAAASSGSGSLMDYRVRYQRINIEDLGDLAELEKLETMAIQNRGVYILGKEKFTIQATGTIILLLNYLEKIPESERPSPAASLMSMGTTLPPRSQQS